MITLLIDGIECKVHEDNLQLPLFQASRLRSVAAWLDYLVLPRSSIAIMISTLRTTARSYI